MSDFTQRFIFDDTDVRGELVGLSGSYQQGLAKHDYRAPWRNCSVSCWLLPPCWSAPEVRRPAGTAGALRRAGAAADGECSSEGDVRGIARYDAERVAEGDGLRQLMPKALMAMTVDPTQGQRYQGIVSLDGATLAD